MLKIVDVLIFCWFPENEILALLTFAHFHLSQHTLLARDQKDSLFDSHLYVIRFSQRGARGIAQNFPGAWRKAILKQNCSCKIA